MMEKQSDQSLLAKAALHSCVNSNLPSFVSFWAQFWVVFFSLSLSSPLFKPRHAKTEFAVIPVLVRVFMLLI